MGEPLDPDTWHWTRDKLGGGRLYINNTYGQTETATTWSSCIVGATPTKPGSCGPVMPGFVGHVLRPDGSEAAPEELGALTLSQPWPSLARTVWQDHARYVETYLAPFPGHYYTADAALFDRDGQLWVTGRIDEVINVAGHRIGTMELEAALLTHPAVSEAAVVPQVDELKGLVPVAFVVLRAGHAHAPSLERELIARVVDAVGAIARPARIIVVPTVPRTRSGKIMRRVLRDLLAADSPGGDLTSLDNPEAVAIVRQHVLAASAATTKPGEPPDMDATTEDKPAPEHHRDRAGEAHLAGRERPPRPQRGLRRPRAPAQGAAASLSQVPARR